MAAFNVGSYLILKRPVYLELGKDQKQKYKRISHNSFFQLKSIHLMKFEVKREITLNHKNDPPKLVYFKMSAKVIASTV